MKKLILFFIFILFGTILGCSNSPPAPTPNLDAALTQALKTALASVPTSTPTPSPTFTVTPTPTKISPVLENTPIPNISQIISNENANQIVELARYGKGVIEDVDHSPDGRFLGVASSLGIHIYDALTMDEFHFIDTQVGVSSISFSPDGNFVASGDIQGSIQIWNTENGDLINTFNGHTDTVIDVAFSPDGKLLGSGSLDGRTILWRIADGKIQHTLIGEQSYSVKDIDFSPDGTLIAAAQATRIVYLWDVESGKNIFDRSNEAWGNLWFIPKTPRRTDTVHQVTFASDEYTLISATFNGAVSQWQIPDGKQLRKHDWPGGAALCSMTTSPNGKIIATGWTDGKIRLWDDTTNTSLGSFTGHTGWVCSLSFSPDGKLLASGSDDGFVHVWNLSDSTQQHTLKMSSGYSSLGISKNGDLLAAGEYNGEIQLWNIPNGSISQSLSIHEFAVLKMSFSSDEISLLSASYGGEISWCSYY